MWDSRYFRKFGGGFKNTTRYRPFSPNQLKRRFITMLYVTMWPFTVVAPCSAFKYGTSTYWLYALVWRYHLRLNVRTYKQRKPLADIFLLFHRIQVLYPQNFFYFLRLTITEAVISLSHRLLSLSGGGETTELYNSGAFSLFSQSLTCIAHLCGTKEAFSQWYFQVVELELAIVIVGLTWSYFSSAKMGHFLNTTERLAS